MDKKDSKKLFIIQPPGDVQYFDPGFMEIKKNLNKILSYLKITNPYGKSTSIKYKFLMEEQYIANARKEKKDTATYEITMSDGFARYFWITSSSFLFDEINLLPWIDECKINNELFKSKEQKLSKKEMIAKYAYDIISYCVILHEFSHIILGHLDYLNDVMRLNCLSEFQEEKRDYSLEEIKIRKDEIYLHALKSCSKAGKQFTLVDSFDLLTVAQNALNLSFVDNVIEKINIRRYQHKVEFVNT